MQYTDNSKLKKLLLKIDKVWRILEYCPSFGQIQCIFRTEFAIKSKVLNFKRSLCDLKMQPWEVAFIWKHNRLTTDVTIYKSFEIKILQFEEDQKFDLNISGMLPRLCNIYDTQEQILTIISNLLFFIYIYLYFLYLFIFNFNLNF